MKKLIEKVKTSRKKIVSLSNIVLMSLILGTTPVYAAGSNTSSIDGFITFVCDWLLKIGGVVSLVGELCLLLVGKEMMRKVNLVL